MRKRWAILTEIAAELGMTVFKVRDILASEGWIVLRGGSSKKKVFLPSGKAGNMSRKKWRPGQKPRGRRATYEWDCEFVKKVVLENKDKPVRPVQVEKLPPLPLEWQHFIKAFSCADPAERERHLQLSQEYSETDGIFKNE